MEMQQMMEFLLKEMGADKEDFMAKLDADRKTDKEKIKTGHK
jgi:uncharacterized protein YyaL (SSP411 family)